MNQERPAPLHPRVKLQIGQRGVRRMRNWTFFSDIEFRPKSKLDSTCTIVALECGNVAIPTPRWEGRDSQRSSVFLAGVPNVDESQI
jgi:hypothetical protein